MDGLKDRLADFERFIKEAEGDKTKAKDVAKAREEVKKMHAALAD